MPTMKNKSTKTVKNGTLASNEFGDVLTLGEAASYLRISEAEVARMVETQGLPARRIGLEWRFLKSAIQGWLAGIPAKSNKQALLNLAGKFKDDPYLEEITRQAYQRRRQSVGEAGE